LPIVEITLVQGRPADARLALMKEITDVVERTLGAPAGREISGEGFFRLTPAIRFYVAIRRGRGSAGTSPYQTTFSRCAAGRASL
jgi:hypothetical protein